MKMRSRLVLLMLSAFLAGAVQAYAGDGADAKKHSVAKPKPVIAAPADCKVKSKVLAAKANEKRKQFVTERENSGQLQGAKVEYHPDAAKHHRDKK